MRSGLTSKSAARRRAPCSEWTITASISASSLVKVRPIRLPFSGSRQCIVKTRGRFGGRRRRSSEGIGSHMKWTMSAASAWRR